MMLNYIDLNTEQRAEIEWDIINNEKLTYEERYLLLMDVRMEYKCAECFENLQNCKCE